jgi:hypothetical protein
MKILRLLLAIFTIGLVITSCQKDFSFEAGNAKGTLLKTATGDCDGINVQGIYYKDTILRPTNYVDVQVDFSKIGTYTIKSDTVNGYSFSTTGNVAALGINTVRLVASGKPLLDGFDVFTLSYNNTTCIFNVQVILGTGGGSTAAVYAFGTTGTLCTGATPAGTYTAGVAMTPANTVTIPVTVTTAGTYNITTAVNGVTFSGIGSLALTTTSIVLTATGTTPTSTMSSSSTFQINSGTTMCEFAITFGATPSAALYTFDCGSSSATINGNYQVGVNTASASNYIDFPIIVTSAGSISVSTNAVNGFSFTGSSVVSLTSTSIRLYATGTPTTGAPFTTFTVSTTTPVSACTVSVPVTDGTLSFVNGTTTYNFNFVNGADTVFNNNSPLPNDYDLLIGGQSTASTANDIFDISITKLTPFAAGTYDANSLAMGVLLTATYTNTAGTVFDDFTPSTLSPLFNVIVTSITTTRVKGTFSGKLESSTGVPFIITNGQFDLPLQ